jgi:hypothetical protein
VLNDPFALPPSGPTSEPSVHSGRSAGHSRQQRQRTAPAGQAFRDPGDAALARRLDIEAVRPEHDRSRLSGFAARLRSRFPNLSDSKANGLATEWANKGITEEIAAAWWDAGLGPHDHGTVQALRSHGLQPADLALRVDGQRVGALLRGGASAAYVVGLLRQHRAG